MAVINQEWLNQNSGRAYPLAEDATLAPVQPSVMAQLPNYVLVDFVATIPSGLQGRYGLLSMSAAGGYITLVFGCDGAEAAVCGFTVASHTPGSAYRLSGVGDYADIDGWVAVGDIVRFVEEYPDGVYTFADGAAPLEACVVRPALRGVRSITVNGVSLADDVELVEGANIRLTADPTTKRIRVDAVPGAGYVESCTGAGGVIRTINGIPVANVWITGDGECVEVTEEDNRIIISDKCSKPCCGCAELDFLREQYNLFKSDVAALNAYASRLDSNVEAFKASVLTALGGA